MPVQIVVLSVIVVPAILCLIPSWLASRKRLELYWSRPCQGRRWKRQFPGGSNMEIRAFLDLFVNAFSFRRKQRLCFAPEDKVHDIYDTIYGTQGGMADCMELETLVEDLEETYEIAVTPLWRLDITLGDLFALTRGPTA